MSKLPDSNFIFFPLNSFFYWHCRYFSLVLGLPNGGMQCAGYPPYNRHRWQMLFLHLATRYPVDRQIDGSPGKIPTCRYDIAYSRPGQEAKSHWYGGPWDLE